MSSDIVITGAARTPIGSFQGELSNARAPELGASSIRSAIEKSKIDPATVDEVLMGCVLPAGLGQAPARQASLGADLPLDVPCTTLNKMCGSGMKCVMVGYDQLKAGNGSVIIAGGMESMTNAPYLLPKMRSGARLGHSEAMDHIFIDGLEDTYEPGRLMGSFAEDCAEKYQFTREQQDEFALSSLSNALEAQKNGRFESEIAPFKLKTRKGEIVIEEDEQPGRASPEKIPQLRPAFKKDGTITPANASSISDGAAAIILTHEKEAIARDMPIRAYIRGHQTHAQEPSWFTTAPVPAIKKLLKQTGWSTEDVDLWEVNEAFAVVPMAVMAEIGIAREKLNVHGGACALGHPIGASGARIIVTLLNALETYDLKKGIAALCIGGGEGTAIAIERPNESGRN